MKLRKAYLLYSFTLTGLLWLVGCGSSDSDKSTDNNFEQAGAGGSSDGGKKAQSGAASGGDDGEGQGGKAGLPNSNRGGQGENASYPSGSKNGSGGTSTSGSITTAIVAQEGGASGVCGNAKTEGVEECDDGNQSNLDWCTNRCRVARCGDGFKNGSPGIEVCDAGGDSATCDSDCTFPQCGDGYVNPATGEACDRGPVNQVTLTYGDPTQCSPTCQIPPYCGDGKVTNTGGVVEVCDSKLDPANCKGGCSSTVSSNKVCGNGVVDAGEDCDDGKETKNCTKDCKVSYCGDSYVNTASGEQCDQGARNQTTLTYGDPTQCAPECQIPPYCGDGKVTGTGGVVEVCDTALDPVNCKANCRSNNICGNGITDPGEDCDDGNAGEQKNSLTCNSICTVAQCGDGHLNQAAGEVCDYVKSGRELCQNQESCNFVLVGLRVCNPDCTSATCGDGKVNAAAGEQCDNGPSTAGPGKTEPTSTCNSDCTTSLCGDGKTNDKAGELCDPGTKDTSTCDVDCTLSGCGDKHVNTAALEECDDGGASKTCNAQCKLSRCGDQKIDALAGEQCDDGGESPTCNADCTMRKCGDGKVNGTAGEECDGGPGSKAGEAKKTKNCDSDCTVPICGDGLLNPAAGEKCEPSDKDVPCNATCLVNFCGDGYINAVAGEQCDTGIDSSKECGSNCNPNCYRCGTISCGNGRVEPGEYCDRTASGAIFSDCNTDCTKSACGDGKVNKDPKEPDTVGEVCDDGDENGTPGRCSNDCNGLVSLCGNGTKETGERCDDGGNNGSSGYCNATCTGKSFCSDSVVQSPAETCDWGGGNGQTFVGACRSNCTRCGDGFVNGGINNGVALETCDEGDGMYGALNLNGTYGHCKADCTGLGERCGDGTVNGGTVNGSPVEVCDDANGLNGQPGKCNNNCNGYVPESTGTGGTSGAGGST